MSMRALMVFTCPVLVKHGKFVSLLIPCKLDKHFFKSHEACF